MVDRVFDTSKRYKVLVRDDFQIETVLRSAKMLGYFYYHDISDYKAVKARVFFLRPNHSNRAITTRDARYYCEVGFEIKEHYFDTTDSIPLEWYDLAKMVNYEVQ